MQIFDSVESERLILKRYEKEDAKILFNSIKQNLDHLSEVMVKSVRELSSISDTEQLIDMINRFWDNQEKFVIPIWLKDSKSLVGESYLGYFNPEETEGEIGYLLFEEFQGKGFAYEATTSLIKKLFENTSLKRIWLKCDSDNSRSIKLALKCGFIEQKDNTNQTRIKYDNTEIKMLTFFLDNNIQFNKMRI